MNRTMAEILVEEAPSWGVVLQRQGDRIKLLPSGRCPPEFRELLRKHKSEVLDVLEAHEARLPAGCGPWLTVARQVLNGEFDGLDRSTREALEIGLRTAGHPLCKQALARLDAAQRQEASS